MADRDLASSQEPGARPKAAAGSILVLILFVAAAVLAWRALGSPPLIEDQETGSAGTLPEGWTELPGPPQWREGMAFVWTGSELLAWGGCDPAVRDRCAPSADGFSFDPYTRAWRDLPEAPAASGDGHGVWTGGQAIFLELGDQDAPAGQAYHPATETWRSVPAAPISPRRGAVVLWTGDEVMVWGGGSPHGSTARTGAAYDPAANTWRRLPDAPIGLNLASGMWTGREVLVFGSLLDNRNRAATRTSVGAAYDPVANAWRELPPSRLSPQATSAAWVGGRMVAWDYEVHSQEYDPLRDAWSRPQRMPLQFSECYPDSVVAQEVLFAFFCGQAALYDPAAGTWQRVRGGPLDEEVRSEAYQDSVPLWRFADMTAAGEVVLFASEGITLDPEGVACYGCPGSPTSFWAYRPPTGHE